MSEVINLTLNAAKRFAKSTLYTERMARGGIPGKTPSGANGGGFWAKITDADRTTGRYSWEALQRQDPDQSNVLDTGENFPTGDKDTDEPTDELQPYAVEADNNSKWVLLDSIVWMYPGVDQDYYIFEYHPGTVIAVLAANDTINKRSGSTPGDAEVQPKWLDSETFADWGEPITVYNWSSMDITSEEDPKQDLWITLSYGDGVWYVSGVDCPGEDA